MKLLYLFNCAVSMAIIGFQAASAQNCRCQSSNDLPIQAGAYGESNRPQIHYSPSSGFMNDPNGLVYSNGTYHLYYQYNPYDRVAGNQHWGHAVSTDLLHWQNRPLAIRPDVPGNGIFSGSAVVDANNTSGFFNSSIPEQERIVAMYTLYTPTSQTQEIAYSLDGGDTFIKYSKNPVIDLNSTQFRDPKVFWHAKSQKWIVATVLAQHYQVIFFSSPDLKNWTEISRFGPAGWLGFQYEVPDLVEMPIEGTSKTKWVLFLSINPGAPLGGSFIEYFVGNFNGTHFVPDDYSIATQDFGKDYYAGQTWSNLPADQGVIGLAWANNWEYTNQVPAVGNWRTIQSLPRKLTLRYTNPNPEVTRLVVASTPVALDPLNPQIIYQSSKTSVNVPGNSTTDTFPLVGQAAFEFHVNASSSINDATNATLQITIQSDDVKHHESISIRYSNNQLSIDRGNAQKAWYNPFFVDKLSTFVQNIPTTSSTPSIKLRGIIDRSVLELFVNDGTQSAVVLFYMSDGRKPGSMTVEVTNGMAVRTIATSLSGIWDCGNCSTNSLIARDEF